MSGEKDREFRELAREQNHADKYMRRRTIEAGEAYETIINEIGVLENGNLGVILCAAGDEFLLEFSIDDYINGEKDTELHKFLTALPLELNQPISLSELEMLSFDVYFDENMENISIRGNDFDIPIQYIDDEVISLEKNDIESIEQKISLYKEYYESDPTDTNGDGFRCIVSNVEAVDNHNFGVTVTTISGEEITWTIEVPLSTEPSASPVALFVEEVGHGDPRQIEGEEVVLLHESDTDKYLETIGVDKSKEWHLVVPSVFSDWDNVRKSERKNNKNNSTGKNRDQNSHSKRHQALMYGFTTPITIYAAQLAVEILIFDSLPDGEANEIQNTEVFELTMSMLDLIMVLGPLFGIMVFIFLTLNEKLN